MILMIQVNLGHETLISARSSSCVAVLRDLRQKVRLRFGPGLGSTGKPDYW